MSGFGGLAKGGWHPKGKDGSSRESWRGDFKGINQVAGLMGKKKGPGSEKEDPRDHSSAPLSTLKDPSSFGPPPKHAHYHGADAAAATSRPPPSAPKAADRSGWGAPVPAPTRMSEEQAEEEEKPKGPALPYRANTTGINPATLPKPPTRYEQPAEPESPVPARSAQATTRPQPPPGLPPRQNSHPDMNAPEPPPAYTAVGSPSSQPAQPGYINQAATSRLGQAGVSVPGFNIGSTRSPGPASPPPRQAAAPQSTDQRSELASRFARMGKPSSPSPASSPAPTAGTGTSWAQKQAALTTASNLKKDPSSVSFSDARNAAGTANNFRERHGDQVAAGWKQANGINQKYGVADRARSFGVGAQEPADNAAPATSTAPGSTGAQETGVVGQQTLGAIAAKKAPPPRPPPKRQGLSTSSVSGGTDDTAPPPIPLGSKPR
ncbi:MAG: hypothetical protein M1828_001253 [Chrysothrix sp. TS-e1954]|nr:MAG: hypothetical protein M1828_001253 [Chrysothrix sp. TS-e1954]